MTSKCSKNNLYGKRKQHLILRIFWNRLLEGLWNIHCYRLKPLHSPADAEDQTAGKQPCRKAPGGPVGHQVEQEPAMCPCRQGD